MAYESESCHWYTQSGDSAHETNYADPKGKKYSDPEVLAQWHKDKGQRATSLKDARKLNLVPSVSGILGQLDKPALTIWKINEHLKVAHRLPHVEDFDQWKDSITTAQREERTEADVGTRIHGVIESWYSGSWNSSNNEEDVDRVNAVVDLIEELFPNREWSTERSFASPLGYGGCCDLHSEYKKIPVLMDEVWSKKDPIVLDFKTKDDKWFKTQSLYGDNTNACQLESYGKGLGLDNPILVNVFISRESDQVAYKIWDKSDVYWEKFQLLLKLWCLEKGYDGAF